MNELQQLEGFLCAQLCADPVTSLALAMLWLDPLHDEDRFLDNFDEEIYYALKAFKGVSALLPYYAELAQLALTGTYQEAEERVAEILGGFGFDNDYTDMLMYVAQGIPLPQYGMDVYNPDEEETRPEIMQLVEMFDGFDDPQIAPYLHRHIFQSVVIYDQQDAQVITDRDLYSIGCLIGWVFSCTGNSSIDYSLEDLEGMQPLSWDDADFAFALEIIDEADKIMEHALNGMELLNQPEWQSLLKQNITNVSEAIERGEKIYGGDHQCQFKLEWAIDQSGLADTAELAA